MKYKEITTGKFSQLKNSRTILPSIKPVRSAAFTESIPYFQQKINLKSYYSYGNSIYI